MKYIEYANISGKAMIAACMAYDHARSSEKLTDWKCIGDNNPAWTIGPFVSAGANNQQIDHTHPYCIKTSDEFNKALGLVLGPNPERSANGGFRLPLPLKGKSESQVEPVIAKLAIIEQFELFKIFLMTFDGPYNLKRRKQWEGAIQPEVLQSVTAHTDRRNELTHDAEYPLPTMMESIDYFSGLRQNARQLYEAYENSIPHTNLASSN